jgi:predicted GNAT family acetyltransferase
MPTRLNNFQAHLARNNPKFNVNKNTRGNVRVTRKNINKNNVSATFRNNNGGNALTVQTLSTNNAYKGKGYQKAFVTAAENAARKAGYKKLKATSIYMIFPWNNKLPTNKNEPNSYYIFTKLGFKVVKITGTRGVYKINSENRYSVRLNKNLV